MATDLSESCLVSHKAFQINNKRLARQKHARVCRLRPGPQSRQPIVLSLFFSLWWSVVLNSWHISPHMLTSKIAFCQYEGKDSFGFNGVGQLMSSIRTIENNHNVHNRLCVGDGFPVYMNEWGTSLVQMTWKHPSKWKPQEDVGEGLHMTASAQVYHQAAHTEIWDLLHQNDWSKTVDHSVNHEADVV